MYRQTAGQTEWAMTSQQPCRYRHCLM